MSSGTIVVWFSCGAASAVAAKKTIERYSDKFNIRIVNNPVIEEHEDNRRFLKDIENWLGIKIETATNSKYPTCSASDVWKKHKIMSLITGAPCTMELKRYARQEWENKNKFDYMVLGFTYDEIKRHEAFVSRERKNLLPVLIDLKITKEHCFKIIELAGIKLPEIYKLGFPNANCVGCVKATSPTYWNHVRQVFPETFMERADLSRQLGAKLVRYKGKRIYLDELPVDAKGRALKKTGVECGIFCEEKL